jgi:uncharacterized protein
LFAPAWTRKGTRGARELLPHEYLCVCTHVCTIEKEKNNVRTHGVHFAEAEPVFDDENAITTLDDVSDPSEQRFVTIGMGAIGRVLVVTYTHRGDNYRIINARKANKTELQEYGGQA